MKGVFSDCGAPIADVNSVLYSTGMLWILRSKFASISCLRTGMAMEQASSIFCHVAGLVLSSIILRVPRT